MIYVTDLTEYLFCPHKLYLKIKESRSSNFRNVNWINNTKYTRKCYKEKK